MYRQNKLNEEGFALVLELVVVVMVLSAVGFGLFQYSNHSKVASSVKAPSTAVTAATDVNVALEKSASLDAAESTGADALGDELQSADAASADVEGGIDEASF